MSQSVFHDLSISLPEKERRELLHKIKKSLATGEEEEIGGISQEDSPKLFKDIIRKEIEQLSLLQRFILWLKQIFFGKKQEEIYLDQKTQVLKRAISRKNSALTGFETRNLTPEFANIIYDLYLAVVPVIGVFKKFFTERTFMEEGVLYLLEKRLDAPINKLEQIMTTEEMEEIFDKTGNKEAVKKVVEQRLAVYIKGLSNVVFSEVENILIPIYYMKEIVLFPYASFFQLFNYVPDQNSEQKPVFKNASALFSLSYLEKLLVSLQIFDIVNHPMNIEPDVLAILARLNLTRAEIEKEEEALRLADEAADVLSSDFRYLGEKAGLTNSSLPLLDIIRYFKRNPYYKVKLNLPHVKIKEFYANVIKLRMLSFVESSFMEIKKNVLMKKQEVLFEKRTFRDLRFYRTFDSFDPKAQGLSYFYHTWSIAVLQNYILNFYKEEIQIIIQILARGILLQNRITQNRMLLAASAIEDVSDKITAVDMSLSPDGENGKMLHRFRFQKQNDAMAHKVYQTMVQQTNKEIRGFLDRSMEAFVSLKSMFEEIYRSNQDNVKTQLKKLYRIEDDIKPMEEHLKRWANSISLLISLLESIISLERS